jgi:thiosulfate dehydrogenase [quinone] large subunit
MTTSTRTHDLRAQAVTARQLLSERFAGLPAWVVVTQLFIGLGWLRAVTEKLMDPDWWTGDVLRDFVSSHADTTLGWYAPFVNSVALPLAAGVALVVVVGQLLAGISLVTGRRLNVGLAVGMFMNLHFMAAGAVTPSAFYLLAQGALVLWLCEQKPNRFTTKALSATAVVAMFVAGLNLAFVSTIHPADVIEDPAVMFSFGGALTALACLLAATPSQKHSLGWPDANGEPS